MPHSQPVARDFVTSQFLIHYKNNGFPELTPCPLLTDDDGTTLFTGSVSNHFLQEKNKGEPIFTKTESVLQPCLRFRLLRDMKNDPDYNPFYMTYFEMLGAFAPCGYEEIKKLTCDFLSDGLGIPANSLVVKVPGNNSFLQDGYGQNIRVVVGEEDESYYKWNYGDPAITGEGVTIAVTGVSARQEETFDLGNIIEVRQDGKAVGYEVAFGVECLMAAVDQNTNLFDHTLIKGETNLNTDDPTVKKMLDAMASATAIGTTGISYNPGRTKKNGRNDCYRGLLSVLYKIYQNSGREITEEAFMSAQQSFLNKFDRPSNIIDEMKRFAFNQRGDFNFPV